MRHLAVCAQCQELASWRCVPAQLLPVLEIDCTTRGGGDWLSTTCHAIVRQQGCQQLSTLELQRRADDLQGLAAGREWQQQLQANAAASCRATPCCHTRSRCHCLAANPFLLMTSLHLPLRIEQPQGGLEVGLLPGTFEWCAALWQCNVAGAHACSEGEGGQGSASSNS